MSDNSTTGQPHRLPAPKPMDSGNEVSWQSAFWGVFSLALNTFLQNPGNFALVTNGPARLVRTSPFVCAFECLDNTITLLVKRSVGKLSWSKAAANILRDRGLEARRNDAEANTLTRFITVFLAVSQLVKLTGMSGIPFTVFCGWTYFAAFAALETVKVMATRLPDSQPFTEVSEQPVAPTLFHNLRFRRIRNESMQDFIRAQGRLHGYLGAIILQFALIVKLTASAAPDQLWPEHRPESCSKRLDWYVSEDRVWPARLLGFPWLLVSMFPGVYLVMLVALAIYIIVYMLCAILLALLFVLSAPFTRTIRQRLTDWWAEGTPQLRTSKDVKEFVFGLTSMTCVGWIFYHYPCLEFFLSILMFYVDNVICHLPPTVFYAAVFGIPTLKYVLRSAAKIGFLSNVKALESNHTEIISSVWFFTAAFFYYLAVYDASSTLKPAWTEALG